MSTRKRLALGIVVLALAALVGIRLFGAGPGETGASGATATVLAIGLWDGAVPQLAKAGKPLGVEVRNIPVDKVGPEPLMPPGQTAKLALVLNAPVDKLAVYRKAMTDLHAAGTTIVAVDSRDWQGSLVAEGVIVRDEQATKYWRFGGEVNFGRLMTYLAAHYLGGKNAIEPPVPVPTEGVYHPDVKDPFPTVAAYETWYTAQGRLKQDMPRVAYVIHASFLLLKDTEDIDALIHTFEKHGFAIYTIFADAEDKLRERLLAVHPDIVMTQRHTGLGRPANGGTPLPETLGVPYFKPISALHTTIRAWQERPEGLTPGDLAGQVIAQELEGTIEPLLVSAIKTEGETRAHEAIPERMERLADRAASWVALRRTPNKDKRIAVLYYNTDLGGEALAQGSATGMFLDTPVSLLRMFKAMKDKGYAVEVPESPEKLIDRMRANGRNYGPWAQAEIDQMAAGGHAVLVKVTDYQRWFSAHLTEEAQKSVIEHYGAPPGKLMVTSIHGEAEIVLPRVEVGPNVWLFPQPEKGSRQDARLIHDQRVPPSHQYIAFYLWLQEGMKAHAVVHFGTHGTLELLPRRAAGMGPDDYADALLGAMPNINPWILDNVGEATLARRRAYAVLVDHLTPAYEPVKAAAPLRAMHEDVEKALSLEPGPVRETMAIKILAQMRTLSFAVDLIRPKDGKELTSLDAEQIKEIDIRLHSLEEERVPRSLHVLGEPPAGNRRVEMLASILGRGFADKMGGGAAANNVIRCATEDRRTPEDCLTAVPARAEADRGELLEKLKTAVKLSAALDRTTDEITHTLDALEGKYVVPGPSNDPVRNPAALPTGRNMYALNPEQVPSDAAMIVAKKLAEDMIDAHRKKHDGAYPKKIAINMNGMETMRDTGVTEGQALALIGAEPVRDDRGIVADVKIIPREKLGRPRVDVMLAIGGMYRDNFPSRVRLIDKALKLAQASPEPDNALASNTREAEKTLEAGGMSHDSAVRNAKLRIFGTAPGQYATSLLYIMPKSGEWKDRKELAEVYRENMRFAYGEDVWGEQSDAPYAAALNGAEAVSHVWSSAMASPLTNHHVYEYMGGLSMAVESANGGKKPDELIADAREPDRSRIRQLDEVLSTESSSRLLNEGWVKEMQKNGYAGAGHVAAYTENLFGWATSVPGSVDPEVFAKVKKIYLEDEGKLGTRKWMEESSPEALLSVTTTLIESSRLGYWKPSAAEQQKLVADYMEQVAKGGPPTGMMGANNQKLEAYVKETYAAPGASIPKATVAAYEAKVKAAHAAAEAASKALGAAQAKGAQGAPASGSPQVEGFSMRKTEPRPEAAPQSTEGSAGLWAAGSALSVIALAFGVGISRNRPRRRKDMENKRGTTEQASDKP
ncbi:MAG: cobaltochelatase subunit CobN [Byssovorax sp.]